MSVIIQALEREQMVEGLPKFGPGDQVTVNVRIKEGERERIQAFTGVVMGLRKRGLNSSFTVRKISYGEGVERIFPLHSRLIESIVVERYGKVRRAKLGYIRNLSEKKARIKGKILRKKTEIGSAVAEPKPVEMIDSTE